jgi:hypothetical protein
LPGLSKLFVHSYLGYEALKRTYVEALAWIVGSTSAVLLLAWWAERRWQSVNSYYEHEQRDPLISDVGSWIGGDRGT